MNSIQPMSVAEHQCNSPLQGNPSARKKRGFTLIELLVVIAIIAILAAILFPVFTMAKEKGRQAMCLSNQRQLGMALRLYVQNNDSRYPQVNGSDRSDRQYGWLLPVKPYMGNYKFTRCPSNKNGSVLNANLLGVQYGAVVEKVAPKAANIKHTGRVVFSWEWGLPLDPNSIDIYFARQRLYAPNDWYPTYHFNPPHNDGMNVCFADGHVRWIDVSQMPVFSGAPYPWPYTWEAKKISHLLDY